MGKKPLVSIILPCYNAAGDIEKKVSNFLKTEYKNFELIIIDDRSTDDTYEILIKKFSDNPRIRIIRNKIHLGVSPSKNSGIKKSLGKYVSILETDQEVEPDWLSHHVYELEKDENLAGVQSQVLDINNRNRIEMCGLLFLPQTLWVITRGLSQKSNTFKKKEYVGIGAGGCTFRKSILVKIGLYDEKLPYSQVDSDTNWPIWMMGYKTIYIPDSIIYHETFKPLSKSKVKGFYREFNFNKTARVMLKNYELMNIIRYFPQQFVIFAIRAFSHLIKGNFYPMIGFVAANLWNIIVLPDTLRERRKRQSLRKLKDKEFMNTICIKGNFWVIYFNKLRPIISAYYRGGVKSSVMDVLSKKNFNNV